VTNLSDAKRLAEELRNQVEALHIPHQQRSETKPFVDQRRRGGDGSHTHSDPLSLDQSGGSGVV